MVHPGGVAEEKNLTTGAGEKLKNIFGILRQDTISTVQSIFDEKKQFLKKEPVILT